MAITFNPTPRRFFVIRHIPTQLLLPARVPATIWEFDDNGMHEPRLFRTKRAAMNCATCWAQGTWARESRTESNGWEYGPGYTYLAEAVPTAVPGRKREDLEVLPVELVLG